MLILSVLSLFFLRVFLVAADDVTFKNVTFHGYSMYTEKFKKNIASSNSLKEFLPRTVFDKILFENQNIPVIYENALADLKDLDELVIENCGVSEIRPGAIKNAPFLRVLSLKDNEIEEIPEGVFNNLEISVLDLSKNQITTVEDGAFDNMPNLLHINLQDNRIHDWNKNWFYNSPMLNRISFQNNFIESLPSEAFKNLKGIKMFGNLDLTVNLVFSFNLIKKIHPDALKGLTRIRNLWLDHNEITDFDDKILNGVEVDFLRLDHNYIECLNKEVFKAESTHIDSNPFDCTCLESLKTFIKENNKEVVYFFADMDCTAQRIKKKMDDLEKRIKEIALIGKGVENEDVDDNSVITEERPIK